MKVLVTTPQLDKMGGVANYYNVLQPYMPGCVECFPVCKRDGESCFGTIWRLCCDYRDFKNKLADYDLIHINPSLGPKAIIRDGLFLRAAKKKGKKVVVFIHGWDKAFEAKLRKRWLWLFKKYYFRADAIIVLAKEFQRELRSWGYTGAIYTETTAVDDEAVKGFELDKRIAQQRKHINLLFLARVEEAKGIYEAIKAYHLLKGKYHSLRLTVAGDGSELKAVKEYVKSNNVRAVEFAGYVRVKDKGNVFANADIYLLPTHGEGMPGSLLEAMAFGLPIITRPVGGIKDFFEDHKMGFITESKDPKVFADLIKKLILDTSLRQRIGQFNHQYAKEHFLASKVAKRIENIYRSIHSET